MTKSCNSSILPGSNQIHLIYDIKKHGLSKFKHEEFHFFYLNFNINKNYVHSQAMPTLENSVCKSFSPLHPINMHRNTSS